MNLLPLYLRREPSRDPYLLRLSAAKRRKLLDVVGYRTKEQVATDSAPVARWLWHHTSSKPTRRNKHVTVNCYQWKAIWLPDAS